MPRLFDFNIFGGLGSDKKVPASPAMESIRRRRRVIRSIEKRLDDRMSPLEKFSDRLVRGFGTVWFLILNGLFFLIWILINTGYVVGVAAFDPYPFILLTMVVSLEAIFLSIFVLIAQNQESKVSKLREEIDIQVNMIAEQEITKVIHMVSYLMKHLNVPIEKDPELKRMMRPLDTDEIEAELERQLGLSSKQ